MGNNIGYSDEPAKIDTLGIDSYYDGFKKFIENCSTPLTMAIQGDWGSGKTTALKLIEKKIDPKKDNTETSYNQALADFKKTNEGRKCHVIWFNTWQYASFGLNDNLTLALFTHLNSELSKLSDESDKTRSNILNNIIIPSIKTITKTAAEFHSLGPVYEAGEDLIHKLANLDNIHFITETISKLKRTIQSTINTLVPNGKRLVIFIDDLDRLEPKVAVELLEGIKNLMDCEKCVFILAVDSQVIYQGVYSKYGDSCDEERARMFFDKIIQVPFYIPLQKYDTSNFLAQEFLTDVTEETYRDKYRHAVTELIGNNPRSIKRIFNLWELNKCVEKIDDNPQSLYNLFILLTLQQKYNDLYKELIQIVSKSTTREEGISILSTKLLSSEKDASSEKKIHLSTLKTIFDLPEQSYDEASTEFSEISKKQNELNEDEQNNIEKLSNIITQWEDFYALLRNTNQSQAINSNINSLDLPKNILCLLQDINNTRKYTFDTTEKTAISFYLNEKKILSFSKQKDGTVNIVIRNINKLKDFKARRGNVKYDFLILARDTHLTITKVDEEANITILKKIFHAYEISC